MAQDAIPVYKELKQMMVSGKVNAEYKRSELFNAKYLKAENKTTQEYDLLMSLTLDDYRKTYLKKKKGQIAPLQDEIKVVAEI